MDDQTPVTPHGLDALVDGLPGFFEGLRKQAGFGIEPDQVLAAQGLILNMAARGSLPETLHGFKTLLGPIACSSKWQQDEFARQFDAWAARLAPGEAPPSPRPTPDLGRTLNEVGEHGRGAWLRSWPMLAIGAAFILATAYIVFDWLTPDRPATPPPGNPGKTGPGWRVVVLAELSALVRTWLPVVFGVAAVVAFGLGAGYWLIRKWSRWWWEREAEMILRRREASGTPRTTVLKISPPDPWTLRTRLQLVRAAVGLLRRRQVGTGGLAIDVTATLDRCFRHLGPPEPVAARRLVTPEYLVLVDRISLRDHQADWADALVDRLVNEQMPAIRFEFAADPRVCYPRRESHPAWTLTDLVERYPELRLLLFTDGEALIDPWTGRPARWMEAFAAWEVRALLTPLPPASWTSREDRLAEAGFLVEPATPDGLAALASRLAARDGAAPDDPTAPAVEPVPPLPESLRVEPGRWLDPTPPPAEEVERLTRDLRWYLRKDYDWLAACAIYPELRWDLTLELGRVLAAAEGRTREDATVLLRLVRLPWFRQGSFPDWLRLWLRTDLTDGRERAVRGTLEQLLVGSERVENAGFTTGPTLTIAQAAGADGGALGALAQGIRRALARTQDPDGPLNDYVFASFLEGRSPDPLDFRVPASVRALLEAKPEVRPHRASTRPGHRTWIDRMVNASQRLWKHPEVFQPLLRSLVANFPDQVYSDLFDLRLMYSLMYSGSDVSSIPTSGTNLVIVANVKDVLYFRIFDADGKVVVDTDETRLTTQAGPIADLKKQLDSVRPPHELTRSEKDRVIAEVTSIVGRTHSDETVSLLVSLSAEPRRARPCPSQSQSAPPST